MQEKSGEMDIEIHFKDTFRAFSKDEDGRDSTGCTITTFYSLDKRFSLPCTCTPGTPGL